MLNNNPASTNDDRYELAPHTDESSSEPGNAGPDSEDQCRRYGTLSSVEWGMEILTSSISLILLCGIIAIFWFMNDKPLTAWPLSISLNAVISILTTTCSAAMMHSVSASISQLKWLYFNARPQKLFKLEVFDDASRGPYGAVKLLVGMRWNLATLGAWVTIFRLGFAPLTQQAISLGPREIVTPDPTATHGFAHAYNRRMANLEYSVPLDTRMQSAIMTGLYNVSSGPRFTCNGYCRWDSSYLTLGFESVCTNVTLATLSTETCNINGTFCNLTTPAGVQLQTECYETSTGTTFAMNATSGKRFDLKSTKVATVGIYRAGTTLTRAYDINITDCAIYPAIFNYSGGIANGTKISFESKQKVDLGNRPWEPGYDDGVPTVTINQTKVKSLPQFNFSDWDMEALQDIFKTTTFKSSWVEGSGNNVNPGFSAVLGGDVNLTEAFDKMAESMTDYLRDGPNGQIVRGDLVQNVIYVSVRWFWLIGPIAIEVSALLLITLTMIWNKRKVPLLKSSALALLHCQFEQENELK